MMEEPDDLRKQDPASPWLTTMNDEITKATSDHKRRQWREFVESIEHRTDSTNRQFTTSKLGKHSSSRRTRHVLKDVKRMSLETAVSFVSRGCGIVHQRPGHQCNQELLE